MTYIVYSFIWWKRGYNKVLRLGTGYINITYKISSVCWDNRLTWFLTWVRCTGKGETSCFWSYAPDNSSDYLSKLCDVVLIFTLGRRHMAYGDQLKCYTISHNQSQSVRHRINISTLCKISYNRRSVKQCQIELSYTVCEIEIRNQE